jgi:hypothetical protein
MRRKKERLESPVTLFVATQHEALRQMAFRAHRSLADVVRQALTEFLARPGAAEDAPARPEAPTYLTPFHNPKPPPG